MFKQKLYRILCNYLRRTHNDDEINAIVDRVFVEHLKNIYILLFKEVNDYAWVNVDRICYIERIKNENHVYTESRMFVIKCKQLDLTEVFGDNDDFLRCSGNLIVNINRIKKYDSYMNKL